MRPSVPYTSQDHDDLETAALLLRGVLDRHPLYFNVQILTCLLTAIQNIETGERYVDYMIEEASHP